MAAIDVLKRIALPLASRKVRVALATVLASYLTNYFNVSEQTVYTIISTGVAVIIGIAIEDGGLKSNTTKPE